MSRTEQLTHKIMTILDALVIFTNAYNIHIVVGKEEKEGSLFAFGIFHGEEKRFRPIVSSQPFAKTLDEAIDLIKNILIVCKNASTETLKDPENLVAEIINPGYKEINESQVLNDDLIERIVQELKNNQTVDTSTLKTS